MKNSNVACRVLHFSTHDEDCGIGKYQEQFLKSMADLKVPVDNEFFFYSPNQTKHMTAAEFDKVLDELATQLRQFDILHIQHEFSFFFKDELYRTVMLAQSMKKPVIITVHTAPEGHYKQPVKGGLGPRSILHYQREKKLYEQKEAVHMRAIAMADHVFVHNQATKQDLIKHGVRESVVSLVTMPVPEIQDTLTLHELHEKLAMTEDDVLLGMVGFLSRNKGVDHAIKAIRFLPDNYKLAIIGGVHPSGYDSVYLDELCDLILHLRLTDRVYITGFEPDDDRLNALIRECDVCVYPYNKEYYGYVSSAALSNALANQRPTVTYPVGPFVEMNGDNTLAITKSANYYELARTVSTMDMVRYAEAAASYAKAHSYPNEARLLAERYVAIAQAR